MLQLLVHKELTVVNLTQFLENDLLMLYLIIVALLSKAENVKVLNHCYTLFDFSI